MIRLIHFICLFVVAINCSAQKRYETNTDRKRSFNWLFGDSVWLDFKTNPPIVKSGSKMSALESASAYSDTNGNLLLYSDGLTVWNSKHHIIKNGTGLNGHSSSSQGALFIKHPNFDSLVYLFTTDAQGGVNGFQVNLISIHSNIDSSVIIEKNKVLLNQTCESISATQHQNGLYTWVTVHGKTGNTFYAYLINENGIVKCPVLSNEGFIYDGNNLACQTMSCFSERGNFFVTSIFSSLKVQILSFDNLLGNFSLLKQYTGLSVPTGVVFSNDNKYLYLVERGKQINQIEISSWQSKVILSNINNKYFINHLSKTPYNSIFINILDSFYIPNIINPDSPASKVNLIFKFLNLNGNRIKYGINNFNQSYFYTPSIDYKYHLNCTNNVIDFNGLDTFSANVHQWQIIQPNSNTEATYSTKNISHPFLDTGLYVVKYIAQNGLRQDTVIKSIHLYPKINPHFLGNDTTYIKGDVINKVLKVPSGIYCQMWQDSSSLSTYTATKKGTYYCKAISNAFCEVIDTIVIKECINSNAPIIVKKQNDSLFCSHQDADTFVWYRNNQVYATSTSKLNGMAAIKIRDTGTYRVEILKQGYCPKSSSSYTVNKLGLSASQLADFGVQCFPNPSKGELTIINNNDEAIVYSISDILGKQLNTQTLQQGTNLIELNLTKGIYIISFTIKTTTIHQRLVLQ